MMKCPRALSALAFMLTTCGGSAGYGRSSSRGSTTSGKETKASPLVVGVEGTLSLRPPRQAAPLAGPLRPLSSRRPSVREGAPIDKD